MKRILILNLILWLGVFLAPHKAVGSTGCSVLLYYDAEASGFSMSNLVSILQTAGAQVVTIGVTSSSYDPTSDNWSNYSQVWDARFYVSAPNYCPGPDYGDYLNSNWQTTAVNYIKNGGSFYLQGENNGFPSRNDANGNEAFLLTLGVVSSSFISCPTASGPFASSNDDSGAVTLASSLSGAVSFYGDIVGGIPLSLMVNPLDSFVHTATGWNHANVDRSIVQGWSGASQMPGLSGGSVGQVLMCWDTTMLSPTDYSNVNNMTITNAFFTSVYKWLGGQANCNTPTPTATLTSTSTPTFTPTPTATCSPSYFDGFSSTSTLNNYDYFMNSTEAVTTAAGADYQITGGLFEVAPTNSNNNGGLAIVDNTYFSHSLSTYTVEGDFEMDSYAGSEGLFGIAFQVGPAGSSYSFQWSGNPGNADGGTPDWEIEKDSAGPSITFSFLASGTTGYTLGTTVHLKVVVNGNNFQCYAGSVLIYNVTDNSSPYTSGGAGVRTYGIHSPNVVRIDNLSIYSCGNTPVPTNTMTNTSTSTITATPANTNTPTITSTPTNTATVTQTYTPSNTSTPTATFTPTCVTNVWPDPYNPNTAVNHSLKISCMNSQSKVMIYTIVGELVQTLGQEDACQFADMWGTSYCWDGRTKSGYKVATGVYLYVVQQGTKVVQGGKFLVIDGS